MAIYSSCKALVIGVGRYADPQYDLSYARSDAEAMAEILTSEFGFDKIWRLYDGGIRHYPGESVPVTERDRLIW